VGFYVTLVALVIALTGLTWSFDWVRNGVAYLATGHTAEAHGGKGGKGGKKGMNKEKPAALGAAEQALADQTLNTAVRDAWQRIPAAVSLSAKPLTNLKDPLTVRVNEDASTRFRSDQLTYDARTAAFQKAELYRDKPNGEKFLSMNYDLHVGAILGWPTKILAFLASLVCATLPVTGFFIWWNRLKKNKKPHRQPVAKVARERAVAA
jgi:uncharacterized iron-regulated membrane protein